MQISKNFTLKELTHSDTAIRLSIKNEPDTKCIGNLVLLSRMCLQPIRDHFRSPVRVSSGFRCKKLNKVIGGSLTSQHIEGKAADITVPTVYVGELFNWCRYNLEYDQLILEFNNWVHISYSEKNRMEVLVASKVNGKTIYERLNED